MFHHIFPTFGDVVAGLAWAGIALVVWRELRRPTGYRSKCPACGSRFAHSDPIRVAAWHASHETWCR